MKVPMMKPNPRLTIPALILLFLTYALFGFNDYFTGNIKYLVSLVCTLVFFSAFAFVAFPEILTRLAGNLYRDEDKFLKSLLVLLILVLGLLTHFTGFINNFFFLKLRVAMLPVEPITLFFAVAFGVAGLWLLIHPPHSYITILAWALLWGIVLRVLGIHYLPLDPFTADQIYAVEVAAQRMVEGINPYRDAWGYGDVDNLYIMYFPAMWLPFVPLKAIGLDIRWLNLLTQVGVLLALWSIVRRRERTFDAFLLAVLFMLPDTIFSVVYRQVSPYWLVLVLFLLFAWRGRLVWAGLMVSLMVAMRLPALVVLWFYLFYLWKSRGFLAAFLQGLASLILIALTFLPFLNIGFDQLYYAMFGQVLEHSGNMDWQLALTYLGLSGVFKLAGLEPYLKYLQVALLLLVGAVYFFAASSSFRTFLKWLLLTNVAFLWISPYIYIYYWFPMLLLAVFLYFVREEEGLAQVPPSVSSPSTQGTSAE